jgi:hypothetical protein
MFQTGKIFNEEGTFNIVLTIEGPKDAALIPHRGTSGQRLSRYFVLLIIFPQVNGLLFILLTMVTTNLNPHPPGTSRTMKTIKNQFQRPYF